MTAQGKPFNLWEHSIGPAIAWLLHFVFSYFGIFLAVFTNLCRYFQAQAANADDGLRRTIAGLESNDHLTTYRSILTRRLENLTHWLSDKNYDDSEQNAFTARSYVSLLGFAVAYPVVFLALAWSFWGATGSFGPVSVLPNEASALHRIAVGISLIAAIVVARISISYFRVKHGDASGAVAGVTAFLLTFFGAILISGAGAFSFAIALIVVVAGSGAGGLAGIIAIVVIVAVAVGVASLSSGGSVQMAGIGTLAVFIAVGVITVVSKTADRFSIFVRLLAVAVLALMVAIIAYGFAFIEPSIHGIEIGPDQLGILVFLVVLPLANSIPDWLSFSISRKLLLEIANGRHGAVTSFYFAAADLILAFVFLFVTVVTATIGLALFEHFTILGGGESVLSVRQLISKIASDPTSPDSVWVYYMLFSTVIPTFVHFVVAMGTLILTPMLTPWGRNRTIALLSSPNDSGRRFIGATILASVWTLAIVLTAALFFGTAQFLFGNYPKIASALIAAANWAAGLI